MPTSINTATAFTLPSSYSLELPVAPPYNVSETRPYISSHFFQSPSCQSSRRTCHISLWRRYGLRESRLWLRRECFPWITPSLFCSSITESDSLCSWKLPIAIRCTTRADSILCERARRRQNAESTDIPERMAQGPHVAIHIWDHWDSCTSSTDASPSQVRHGRPDTQLRRSNGRKGNTPLWIRRPANIQSR